MRLGGCTGSISAQLVRCYQSSSNRISMLLNAVFIPSCISMFLGEPTATFDRKRILLVLGHADSLEVAFSVAFEFDVDKVVEFRCETVEFECQCRDIMNRASKQYQNAHSKKRYEMLMDGGKVRPLFQHAHHCGRGR